MTLTVVNIVVLLALALFTFMYMRQTRRLADDTKRMADIMAREFELRIAPFVVLETMPTFGEGESKEYQPVICNKGSLPVRIRRVVLEWWYKESPDRAYRKETLRDKALGRDQCTRSGEYVITLKQADMVKEDFPASQNLDPLPTTSIGSGQDILCIRGCRRNRAGDGGTAVSRNAIGNGRRSKACKEVKADAKSNRNRFGNH